MFSSVQRQRKTIIVHSPANRWSTGRRSRSTMRLRPVRSLCSEFTVNCQGVGVLPPLSLSSTAIHFPATPINDQSIAAFYVENRHVDKNHFKHPVPRVGNGQHCSLPRCDLYPRCRRDRCGWTNVISIRRTCECTDYHVAAGRNGRARNGKNFRAKSQTSPLFDEPPWSLEAKDHRTISAQADE